MTLGEWGALDSALLERRNNCHIISAAGWPLLQLEDIYQQGGHSFQELMQEPPFGTLKQPIELLKKVHS